jgi:hypothetical protein
VSSFIILSTAQVPPPIEIAQRREVQILTAKGVANMNNEWMARLFQTQNRRAISSCSNGF